LPKDALFCFRCAPPNLFLRFARCDQLTAQAWHLLV
jgi:hypothetical protein